MRGSTRSGRRAAFRIRRCLLRMRRRIETVFAMELEESTGGICLQIILPLKLKSVRILDNMLKRTSDEMRPRPKVDRWRRWLSEQHRVVTVEHFEYGTSHDAATTMDS